MAGGLGGAASRTGGIGAERLRVAAGAVACVPTANRELCSPPHAAMLTRAPVCCAGVLAAAAMLSGCASAPSLILQADRACRHRASIARSRSFPSVGAATADFAGIDRVDPQEYAEGRRAGARHGGADRCRRRARLLPFALRGGPGRDRWRYRSSSRGPPPSASSAAMLQGAAAHRPFAADGRAGSDDDERRQLCRAARRNGRRGRRRHREVDALSRASVRERRRRRRARGPSVIARQARRGSTACCEIDDHAVRLRGTQRRQGHRGLHDRGSEAARCERLASSSRSRGLAYMSPVARRGALDEGQRRADARRARARIARACRAHRRAHVPAHAVARAAPGHAGVRHRAHRVAGRGRARGPGCAGAGEGRQRPVRCSRGPYPRPRRLDAGPPAGAAVEVLHYDLRIFEEYDWGPGDLVYERAGLRGNEHRIESALKPATMYFWTVRARYAVDGQPRATRWSAADEPRVARSAAVAGRVRNADCAGRGDALRLRGAAGSDALRLSRLHPHRELVPLPHALTRRGSRPPRRRNATRRGLRARVSSRDASAGIGGAHGHIHGGPS